MNLKSLWLRTQVGGKRVKGKEEGEGQMKAEEKGVGGMRGRERKGVWPFLVSLWLDWR